MVAHLLTKREARFYSASRLTTHFSYYMKTIYFIRHAQSEANLKDILASRQDFPLTAKGRQEAVAIASEFKDIAQLDRIICSPLIRAQQTAQPIAETFGLDVQTDERITEQDLGVHTARVKC